MFLLVMKTEPPAFRCLLITLKSTCSDSRTSTSWLLSFSRRRTWNVADFGFLLMYHSSRKVYSSSVLSDFY